MTLPRTDPALTVFRILVGGGSTSVAVLTLLDRGATRAYSMPWEALLLVAQIAPLLALGVRAWIHRPALRLPSGSWCFAAACFAATLLLSALASPFRGPSFLLTLTPLAALASFFLVHDWAQRDARAGQKILLVIGVFSGLTVLLSLGRWVIVDLITVTGFRPFASLVDYRNAHPLGHSNYTAGLALLITPWLVTAAWRGRTRWHTAGWTLLALLALAMLFSSGSRGGLLGFAGMSVAALWRARLGWKQLALLGLAAGICVAALAYAHPRTRMMLFSPSAATLPNISNVQRSAMVQAGIQMGGDRPASGWGTGTTPLVYPMYRSQLEGGAENVLQLHSTPLQVWADWGIAGALCAALFLWLLIREGRPIAIAGAPAAISLCGYLCFSLTDAQLDVPIFALAVAACSALCARGVSLPTEPRRHPAIALSVVIALSLVALLGRKNPTPDLNVQALGLAQTGKQNDKAVALLRDSVRQNRDQEIAHFNLGWLFVVQDPRQAAEHFLEAARLVPDKGGVYFGLGLSYLNDGNREDAARAFAIECLNDPLFLTSPWWREPAVAALRPHALGWFSQYASVAASVFDSRNDPRVRDARYLVALVDWLEGRGRRGEILARSLTSERVSYFAARPEVPPFASARTRSYRRERTGYPVLMRDTDLPAPMDLFDVREIIFAADELRFLFPPKGWLPSPLLLELLKRK